MSNRRSKLYRTLPLFVVLILVAGAAAGPIMSNVGQPKYKTVTSDGPIEIREYEPIIAAEVDVTGERFAAIREGFRVMAVHFRRQQAASQNRDDGARRTAVSEDRYDRPLHEAV
jgi:hypothetical protein